MENIDDFPIDVRRRVVTGSSRSKHSVEIKQSFTESDGFESSWSRCEDGKGGIEFASGYGSYHASGSSIYDIAEFVPFEPLEGAVVVQSLAYDYGGVESESSFVAWPTKGTWGWHWRHKEDADFYW